MSSPPHHRDWSSLPELTLFDIATRLDPIQLSALAGVCKPWRTICTKLKTQILAHHPPLLLHVYLTAGHTLTAHLHTFPAFRHYTKPILHHFNIPYAEQQGCHHGYVLLYPRDARHSILYLANPFSDHFVELPPLKRRVLAALLTAPPTVPDCAVVAFAFDHMMVCRPGVDDGWSDVHLSTFMPVQNRFLPYDTKQAVFFKGHVYIATHDTVTAVKVEFGKEVSVKKFAPFRIKERPEQDLMDQRSPLCLFPGEEELFAVEMRLRIFPEASIIDFSHRLKDNVGITWEEEIESLGGVTLFATNCSQFVYHDPRVMGREQWGSNDQAFFVDHNWVVKHISVYGGMFLGECDFVCKFDRSPSRISPFWVSPQLFI